MPSHQQGADHHPQWSAGDWVSCLIPRSSSSWPKITRGFARPRAAL